MLPYADKMDDGVLGFYICTSRSWQDLLRLTADAALGNWSNSPFVECRSARKIAISSTRRRSKRLMASVDGELVPLAGRIEAHVLPRALKVLVPKKRIGKPRKKKKTAPASS
jgi:diacylglycerol kinase family enzyme